MIVNLSPLTHIEITVNDAEAAFQVLNKTLGAIKVQEELYKMDSKKKTIVRALPSELNFQLFSQK